MLVLCLLCRGSDISPQVGASAYYDFSLLSSFLRTGRLPLPLPTPREPLHRSVLEEAACPWLHPEEPAL